MPLTVIILRQKPGSAPEFVSLSTCDDAESSLSAAVTVAYPEIVWGELDAPGLYASKDNTSVTSVTVFENVEGPRGWGWVAPTITVAVKETFYLFNTNCESGAVIEQQAARISQLIPEIAALKLTVSTLETINAHTQSKNEELQKQLTAADDLNKIYASNIVAKDNHISILTLNIDTLQTSIATEQLNTIRIKNNTVRQPPSDEQFASCFREIMEFDRSKLRPKGSRKGKY